MKMCTAISLTAVLILCATIADIRTNKMISKQDRKHAVICGSIIILCTVCEWCGQKIDGVAAIRLLHMCVRLIELCMAPVIGVAVAFSYVMPSAENLLLYYVPRRVCISVLRLRKDGIS